MSYFSQTSIVKNFAKIGPYVLKQVEVQLTYVVGIRHRFRESQVQQYIKAKQPEIEIDDETSYPDVGWQGLRLFDT